MEERCWDHTPLMAAAAAGHYWACEVLLEMGADTNFRNGHEMMAADYARDQHTMELIWSYWQGTVLPDQEMLKRREASREASQKYSQFQEAQQQSGLPGGKKEGPRIFQAAKLMALEEAFTHLGAPAEWLPEFRQSGAHFAEVRYLWRKLVLSVHPDKQRADRIRPATRTFPLQIG